MRYLLLAVLFSLGFSSLSAQEVYSSSGKPINEKRKFKDEPDGFDPSKIIWGGTFVLGAGSGVTNLGISPILGYRLTDNFSAGIGTGYQYLKIKNAYSILNAQGLEESKSFSTSTLNFNIWARYVVWNNIFVHVQPEINSLEIPKPDTVFTPTHAYIAYSKERIFVPSMLVGGGIRQPITERVSFVGMILYDVLKDENSPYRGIDLRFGINVGF